MKIKMRTQRKYLCNAFLFLFFVLISCSQNKDDQNKEKKGIESIIVTAKYCYNDYPPSYYFEGSDSIGVNIYFAGLLWNYTTDTVFIPNRELKFSSRYDFSPDESLFYTLFNGDSLFFRAIMLFQKIAPNKGIRLNLQYYVTPENPKLLAIFRNIGRDHTILDTLKICYATPNIQLENGRKLLPPIVLERSKKFRVDTAEYNSYFEQIFFAYEYYENPPKELLKKWNGLYKR